MITIAFPQFQPLNDPTWIEGVSGFPAGSWGDSSTDRPDPTAIVASTAFGEFTGHHAGDIVAFTEYLAGVALDSAERDWLVDAMAQEFESDPAQALAELETVAIATNAIPRLEPLNRAVNRHRALSSIYQLDTHRIRAGLPPNPIMALIQAHNPAVFVAESGVVVTTGAIEARQRINRIILALADRRMTELPNLRADMADRIDHLPKLLTVELANSWIRLVILRAWLADLEPVEFDRLRVRAAEVVDTTTDLDLVGLMLSFRPILEGLFDPEDD